MKIGRREQWLIEEEALQVAPKPIGSGGFSVVLRGKFRESPVAVKVLNMSRHDCLSSIGTELRIHRRLRHSNIVQFHGACVDETNQDIALVLELCVGVSLRCFVGALDPTNSNATRLQCLVGICRALLYLHTRSPAIVHGDLKDQNVMVETRIGAGGQEVAHARLLDFGLSRVITRDSKPLSGTVRWAAPEVFHGGCPRPAADVYSFGLLIFFTVTLRTPHDQLMKEKVRLLATQQRLPPLRWTRNTPFAERCRNVVNAATCMAPDQRRDILHIQDDLLDIMTDEGEGENDMEFDCIDCDFWRAVQQLRHYPNQPLSAATEVGPKKMFL